MIPTLGLGDKLLYEQIYEFYRDAILRKQLKYNFKLPSHRTLSRELGVGNNTVLRAYEQLQHEGYIRTEYRRGLFVAKLDYSDWQLKPPSERNVGQPRPIRNHALKPGIKLTDQVVDEKNFPIKEWRKCTNWALDNINFQYEGDDISDPLKEHLIKYLFYSRGVVTTPERILIGSGSNSLLFWLAFVLKKTAAKIVFEEPCYSRTRHVFSEFDYAIKPVAVNHDGIDLEKLLKEKADLLYLTPSHQYPTGAAIPVGNRIRILNWARKNKVYIIEDDYDCEFRYKIKLMPSLQSLDKSNRVIYLGTFSNSVMPSLRVAYMVLPEGFPVDHKAYSYWTNTVPFITRKTLGNFMERGFWERHLKKMRKLYQGKYYVCISALIKLPDNHIFYNDTPSGLNIFLRINTKLSEPELIKRALKSGIRITPASGFYYDQTNKPLLPEVLFEFGNLNIDEIENVVQKLYRAWFK
jgi:GntR family transcriptional regulator / MocR family aminotransferase